MKNIGIWIDKEKAHVIKVTDNQEEMITILSEIDTFKISGGSGTRFKGGPQDVVHDSKYLEREKKQHKEYFKKIAQLLKEADKVVIFGPAETGQKFNKELKEHYADISKKVKDVLRADSMTDNQTKALIREYFNTNNTFA
ncbi:hypothetical protein D1816_18785 [Aquimarina sp. AD10]|uniref:Host attachment protein n=1 Tax=Aquimarina aggregata TaxID=1642818 RepID=A0A162ZSU8_9FLAO|nr:MULTISPECIES: hypothetical protein [Aquimarina]AXT62321.1 hypothetical protein D1816_18785 [Aquimarina sp. AD10]KZS40005.1 hypothetical protein AWE51_10215 [Aquimarina aggregata]RKM90483.1 hypothetical protein D7033_23595 [Aquimarina sp. AD10]